MMRARSREAIMHEFDGSESILRREAITLEVLLDIRELLAEHTARLDNIESYTQSCAVLAERRLPDAFRLKEPPQ